MIFDVELNRIKSLGQYKGSCSRGLTHNTEDVFQGKVTFTFTQIVPTANAKPEFNGFVDFTSFLIAERQGTELMADPRNDRIETETDVMFQI